MKKELQTSCGAVYNVAYHIIWCPKYRYHLLNDKIANRIKTLLYEVAIKQHIMIVRMEVMPDHIHIFLKADPNQPIRKIVQALKGYTAMQIRKDFPRLANRKAFWSPSYYVETIGHISEHTILRYIENQKRKAKPHATLIPALK